MSKVSDRWAVELNGSEVGKRKWCQKLKEPFFHYVDKIEDSHGKYLVLRSSGFDDLVDSKDVHQAAKDLFGAVNAVVGTSGSINLVTVGAVVEFVSDGPPIRKYFLEAAGITMSASLGCAEFSVKDAQGNVVEPLAKPSTAQLWLRAGDLDRDIRSAQRYLGGEPDWFELYMAHEALKEKEPRICATKSGSPKSGISQKEIRLFKRTANGARHHPNDKHRPPECPMALGEARKLMYRRISKVIDYTIKRDL
ncbi:hypothetical protein [Rhodothalassium salexigens]|uniref:hypothetical protein n=1 Tax=Rhodothalassium salexigens TaxID=1086 RepID=UPI0010465B1F|nr:hypothetical protein [Rhodothalassium salexigens]MBB4212528.1 hypothetical protein [Rhodothalassium salexigens DSM 2132]